MEKIFTFILANIYKLHFRKKLTVFLPKSLGFLGAQGSNAVG